MYGDNSTPVFPKDDALTMIRLALAEDVKIKLQYDMYYFENMSLLLDFQILVRTVYVVLTGKGAQ